LRDIAARDYLGRNAAITNTLRAVGVQGKPKRGENPLPLSTQNEQLYA
jgi:hypothetical protein